MRHFFYSHSSLLKSLAAPPLVKTIVLTSERKPKRAIGAFFCKGNGFFDCVTGRTVIFVPWFRPLEFLEVIRCFYLLVRPSTGLEMLSNWRRQNRRLCKEFTSFSQKHSNITANNTLFLFQLTLQVG